MKKALIIIVSLLLSATLFAQYPEVSIMDIQYQDPAGLLVYFEDDMPSSYEGDTLTVTGIVMVPPYKAANPDSGVLMYVGGGAGGFFLQDTSETDWASVLVRIEGASNYPAFQILDSGTVVKVTGYVNEYSTTTQKTTQFNLLDFTGSEVIGFSPRPEPVELTLDSLKVTGTNTDKAIAEKWEGVYVIIRDVTTFDRTSSGGFRIYDSNNTQLNIGTKSNYYYQNPAPDDGTVLEYIKGYIETRSVGSGGVTLNPGFRDDYNVLLYAPQFSNVTRNPVLVGYGQSVTVNVEIQDQDGSITSAKLFYRKNMMGANNELAMNNVSGNTWQAVIPAQNDSSFIDFFFWAQDNDNNTSLFPADTATGRYHYLVLDRPLTIQDVQYSPLGSGFSGYNSYNVTVRGIVTVDTTDIEGTETGTILGSQVYIQNGSGRWSGINIFGAEADDVRRGDDITVTGPVNENFNVTRIGNTSTPVAITLHSTGNSLPDATPLKTSIIADITNSAVQAERWEGVLIKYENITVADENADGSPGPHSPPTNSNYGDIQVIDDSSQHVTRVSLQYGTHQYHNVWFDSLASLPIRIRENDTFDELVGVLYYSFGNYKLLPRKDDDFVGHTTDVDNELELPNEFELTQNYPNPFNPSTKINYSLPVQANVTLKIFNILGQEVMTLVDNELISAGNHEISFNANGLPTGIYIYSLIANDFVQTKKMILLK
jgi:hypothetical protein